MSGGPFPRRDAAARVGRLVGGLVLTVLAVRPALAAGFKQTPAQVEGPYYPRQKPADSDWNLLDVGGGVLPDGEPLDLSGRVIDKTGRAVAGAVIEIWQCDSRGVYNHPKADDRHKFDQRFQGYGAVETDANGRYRFLTLMPVPYTGRPPHIHVKIREAKREALTTQLYLKDHPENDRDGLLALIFFPGQPKLLIDPVDATLENGLKGKAATFDFVIS